LNDAKIEELFAAIRAGDEEGVFSILDERPELVDSYLAGVSPIRAAIYYGNKELAGKIAQRTADLTIHDAAALGRSGQIRHIEGHVDEFSADGFTPLALAAAFGDADTVRALIEMGAELELFTTNPTIVVAPIHAAAFGGNAGAARALIEAGADANLRGESGFTAIHTAAQNGDAAMVDVLLAGGADPSLLTDEGKTARDFALENDATELAARL
jgi:ankyrin repeat protein